jgi:hypothetical protein
MLTRVRRIGLIVRFSLIGLTVGLLVASALAWYIENRLTELVLDQLTQRAVDQAELVVGSRVTNADFEPPYTRAKLDNLAGRLAPLLQQDRLRSAGLLRLKLYARDGTILYSDYPDERGHVQ